MKIPYHTPLDPAQQATFGIDPAQPLAIADRVRFAELDPLNHVNNVAYLTWFETIRVTYFKLRGLSSYRADDEPRIVIRRAEVDWLAEMRADQDYAVTCRALAYRRTSFTLWQEIWAEGARRATMSSIVVTLEPDASARRPLPGDFIVKMQAEGASPSGS